MGGRRGYRSIVFAKDFGAELGDTWVVCDKFLAGVDVVVIVVVFAVGAEPRLHGFAQYSMRLVAAYLFIQRPRAMRSGRFLEAFVEGGSSVLRAISWMAWANSWMQMFSSS